MTLRPSTGTAFDNIILQGGPGRIYTNELYTNSTITPRSDRRLKDQIAPLSQGLSAVEQLKPSTFVWKDPRFPGTQLGFIAQDVQEVIPELVRDNSGTLYLN